MPHAYRPSLHKPGPVIPGLACDLSFVGTGYWSRADFFEAMDLEGLDVLLAGNWQVLKSRPGSPLHRYLSHDVDQCLTNEETVRVYQSSRAGINFYRREGAADGEAPMLQGVAMGPREVEMAASGCWFLRDPRPEGDECCRCCPRSAARRRPARSFAGGWRATRSAKTLPGPRVRPSQTVHLATTPRCCCGSWIASQ